MADDTTERFFLWMEAHNIKRAPAAALLGVDERSLSNYRSRGLPQKKLALAERLMSEPVASPHQEDDDNKINVVLSDEEFELVQRAASIVQTTFKDFIIRATIAKAREELNREAREKTASSLRVAEDPAVYGSQSKSSRSGSA